jgi:CheY-like chemotaxis protein
LVTRLLEKCGHRVTLAANGRDAVDLVARAHAGGTVDFDLILMDIFMPGLGGVEASRAIREIYAGHDRPPIVALTANAFDEDRARYLDAGLDDYLAKPFDPAQLDALLDRWPGKIPVGAASPAAPASVCSAA